jgi:hypothetical protein
MKHLKSLLISTSSRSHVRRLFVIGGFREKRRREELESSTDTREWGIEAGSARICG